MTKLNKIVVITFVYALILLVGTSIAVSRLDAATAEQCRTHDWPVEQHYTHMDWCLDNGYPTN